MGRRNCVETLERRALMSVGVAGVLPAADRFEPNDGFSAAADLGSLGDRTENGLTIHAAGNGDYFKFKASSSGAASVRVVFDQAAGDLDAFLLDADRLLLDSSATTNSGERLDAEVSSGKTYYVKVIGYNGATNPDYDLVIDAPGSTTAPASDTDDQISEAPSISASGSKSGSVSSGTDVDLYKVTVAAGQTVNFDLDRASGSTLDSYLRLFNSSGTQLKSNNDANAPGESASTPRESYFSHTFSAAGTYYVGVSGNPNTSYSPTGGGGDAAGSKGSYVLRLSGPAVAPSDSDDQISEARSLSVGSSSGNSISNPTDVDLFKFTVRAGQRVGFDIDRPSGSTFDSYLRVFNSSGTRLAGNDDGAAPGESTAGKSSYVEYTFATAGTYYVGVSGDPNTSYRATDGAGDVAGSTGSYTLSLVNRSTTSSPSATVPALRVESVWSERVVEDVLER